MRFFIVLQVPSESRTPNHLPSNSIHTRIDFCFLVLRTFKQVRELSTHSPFFSPPIFPKEDLSPNPIWYLMLSMKSFLIEGTPFPIADEFVGASWTSHLCLGRLYFLSSTSLQRLSVSSLSSTTTCPMGLIHLLKRPESQTSFFLWFTYGSPIHQVKLLLGTTSVHSLTKTAKPIDSRS